ncbi:thermosome subunit alpha [Methanobrevibacter curvatus]|uniref:60 kDa chaperonin n=1 Tax=Methanobrevibacter curvatus TaxID=49547 RepID=A0A162FKU5_9EURY|nr:thermosome subunit alpha [Methanobrevibacter curvatus]KZX11520.1 60 kDa chaperonin [Methanobrevibacter curvatus]
MANNQQPIYIMPEGTERFLGRDALRMNIIAGKALAEIIRTTLGPKGMDKMLVDGFGDVVVTNDGATILKEMDIVHPTARMLVEIAKKQEDNVGDGTTTTVVLAGELLKKAEELLEMGIHQSSIVLGYRLALAKSIDILEDISIKASDKETLLKVAITAMTGKGSDNAKDSLAELIVDAVLNVEDDGSVDKDSINIQRISGGSVEDSYRVDGILIDKGKSDENMPAEVKDAKIALLKYPLEIKDLETDAKIDLTNPLQMQAFLDNEDEMIREMVDKIISSGANVLFCQKGIDDAAMHYLTKAGILAIKRTKKSDMKRLVKATGAEIVTNIDALSSEELGEAGIVYEKKIFDQKMVFVEELKNSKANSIVLRGSTKHVTGEIERALEDALGVVAATIEDDKVVIGGGAPEIEISKRLKEYGETIPGREQLAINSFANALEIVPRTLAENAGLDSINSIVDLIVAHEKSVNYGLDVFSGEIVDMKEKGVVEPQRVKKRAIQYATEATETILRIDDLVAARGSLESQGSDDDGMDNSGMPGTYNGMGQGGMPPMM